MNASSDTPSAVGPTAPPREPAAAMMTGTVLLPPSRERRGTTLARVPFEALVEIAAPQGAAFEAESVDLSASGMHLRTAYLPTVGTPLKFRFESGVHGTAVVASGEVVWAQDGPDGCEFGVRFCELRPDGADAIRQIIGTTSVAAEARTGVRERDACVGARASEASPAPELPFNLQRGAAVRIYIEGVSSPMRATIRDDQTSTAIVGSDLKMLKLGAAVELEDKERRIRRPACVEWVGCELEGTSGVPQLVVKLRYDQPTQEMTMGMGEQMRDDTQPYDPRAGARGGPDPAAQQPSAGTPNERVHTRNVDAPPAGKEPMHGADTSTGSPPTRSDEAVRTALPIDREGARERHGLRTVTSGLRSVGATVSSAFMHVGDAASRLGARAKTTVSLLAKRDGREGDDGRDDEGHETRRTTAAVSIGTSASTRTLRPQAASRDLTSGGARGRGDEFQEGAMQEIDFKRSSRRKQIGLAAGVGVAVVLGAIAFRRPHPVATPSPQAPAPELAPASATPPPPPLPTPPDPATAANAAPAPIPALTGEPTGVDAKGNPNPFGFPSVKRGTRMVLRLDGPVGEIRGLQMPNGFVVSVPNRKSMEAAGPLAAKDARISSAKVANQPGGAELTIAFKDSPPMYQVRAKGDSLEIVLGHEKAVAKVKGKGKGHGSGAAKGKHK